MIRRIVPLGLALLLAASTPALAVGPYFVEVIGGYNAYAMDTVNEYLDSVNEETASAAFEHLDSGGAWGVNVGRVYERRMATSIGYERLHASISSTPPPVVMEVRAPANIVRFQLAYALTRLGPVIPFLQGGAGFIWTNGHLEYEDEFGNDVRHEFSGSTITFEGLAGMEARLNDRFGLNLALGYRWADISSPEWDATSFGGYGTFTGPGFEYTGLVLRAGLRIQLNWGVGEDSALKEAPEQETSREPTGWM